MLFKKRKQQAKETETIVINGLKQLKMATKFEIAQYIGISHSTVNDALNRLELQGKVTKVLIKEKKHERGRPKAKWKLLE